MLYLPAALSFRNLVLWFDFIALRPYHPLVDAESQHSLNMTEQIFHFFKIKFSFHFFLFLFFSFVFFAVESQHTVIANSTTYGRAVGIDNNVWDFIFQQTSFKRHTLLPYKDNCELEWTGTEKQPAYIRTIRLETLVTPIHHNWPSSDMLSPLRRFDCASTH